MNRVRGGGRRFPERGIRAAVVAAAMLASLALSGCRSRSEPGAVTAAPVIEKPSPPPTETPPAEPKPPAPRPVKPPPPPEPPAVEARARQIRRDAEAIRAECRRAAGGDWERWQRDTAPYRAALQARLNDLKEFGDDESAMALRGLRLWVGYEVLEGKNGFPLFEVRAREKLKYLADSQGLDEFRKDKAVVAARAWLAQRGIDLILVCVPKMTEVYIEHFLDSCPADGIIAPRVRQTLLELLEADVEVVDGFPLFRPRREPDPEYLYNTADTHWAPKGMRIIAKEVANRIARYSFGAKARAGPPIVKTTPGTYDIYNSGNGVRPGVMPRLEGWWLLNEEQKRRIVPAQAKTQLHVTLLDGREPPEDPQAPVLLIGHSYVVNFREQLIGELNLLTRTRWTGNQTTECFGDFLREPEMLDGCRVVVWLTTDQHMAEFKPLPAPIATAVPSK
jgi:SGNH hydrolase-like domain, acetyltransferase AlgX